MDFKQKAFIVGVVGDAGLQIIVKSRGDLVGLKKYFDQHGIGESLTIAGGMMFGFGWLFELSGLEMNNTNLFMYGGLLDIAFRKMRLFPSLDGYYESLTPLESFTFGGIPMVLPNIIPL